MKIVKKDKPKHITFPDKGLPKKVLPKLKDGTRRTTLSFKKSELFQLGIGLAGIQMAMPTTDADVQKMLASFGLFGGSSDANKFYPDLNVPESLRPKPEDFVDVPFRLISATTVGAGSWKATDFSNVNVLKGSMEMLKNKPVYFDHETDLMNWVGIVRAVSWSEPTIDNGIPVPAGIDGIISIDGKTSPKIARGVLMGSVFSNSVTVSFDWTPSHQFDSGREFDDKMGEIGPDGKMVRRIVTDIHDYFESSLVWLGADPFAKAIDGKGKLRNIDHSSIYNYKKEAAEVIEKYEKSKNYSVEFGFEKSFAVSLSQRKTFNTTKNDKEMNKELEAALRILLGLAAGVEITAEHFAKVKLVSDTHSAEADAAIALSKKVKELALTAAKKADATATDVKVEDFITNHEFVKSTDLVTLSASATKVTSLESEIVTLKADKKTLEDAATGLQVNAELGKGFVALKKNEVKRLYRIAVGQQEDAAVIKLIDEAAPDALEGLLKQYTKGLTHSFGGKCKACGSEDFTFRSTVSGGAPANELENNVASFDDLHDKFSNKTMNLLEKKTEDKK